MKGQESKDFESLIMAKLSQNKTPDPELNLEILKRHLDKSKNFVGYFSTIEKSESDVKSTTSREQQTVLQIEPKISHPSALLKNISINISEFNEIEKEFLCEIVAFSSRVSLTNIPFSSVDDLDIIMLAIKKSTPCQGLTLPNFIDALQTLDTNGDNLIISRELFSSIFIENHAGFQELVVRSQSCKYLTQKSSFDLDSIVKKEENEAEEDEETSNLVDRTTCIQCLNLLKIPILCNTSAYIKSEKRLTYNAVDSYYKYTYGLKECSVVSKKIDDDQVLIPYKEEPTTSANGLDYDYWNNDPFKDMELSDDEDPEYKLPSEIKKPYVYTYKPKKEYDSDSDNDAIFKETILGEGTTDYQFLERGFSKYYFSQGYAYFIHKNYHSRRQLTCGNAKITGKTAEQKRKLKLAKKAAEEEEEEAKTDPKPIKQEPLGVDGDGDDNDEEKMDVNDDSEEPKLDNLKTEDENRKEDETIKDLKIDEPCKGYAILCHETKLLYITVPHTCQPIEESDFSSNFKDIYRFDPIACPGTLDWSEISTPALRTKVYFSGGYSYRKRGSHNTKIALQCKKRFKGAHKMENINCEGEAIIDKKTKLLHVVAAHSNDNCSPMTKEEAYASLPQSFYVGCKCVKCGEGPFHDKESYEKHKNIHKGEMKRNVYYQRERVRRLELKKEREANHVPTQCCFCPKSFFRVGTCLKHIRDYHKDKDLQSVEGFEDLKKAAREQKLEYCEECGIAVSKLYFHRRTKHEKNYECKICKEFFGMSAYYSHMRKVHQERSSFCSDCGLTFDSESTLKRHWKKTHDPTYVPKFKCPVKCGFVATSQSDIYNHLQFLHHYNWKCDICGKVFTRSTGLKDHLPVHTGKKEFFCFVCDYATPRIEDFQKHRKVKHGIMERISRHEYHAQSEAIGRRNEIRVKEQA